MKLTAEIKATGDADKLYTCFEPELTDQKRSHFEIIKDKKGLIFKIKADDSVALRAVMNGITKLLTTYENVNKNG